jgi:GYF domain 2
MPNVWYIARDGKAHGPITQAVFAEFLRRGHLKPHDYIWHDGLDDWVLGETLLSGLQCVAEPTAPSKQVRGLRGAAAAYWGLLAPWLRRPFEDVRTVVRRWTARWDIALAYLAVAAMLAPVGWGVYRSLF